MITNYFRVMVNHRIARTVQEQVMEITLLVNANRRRQHWCPNTILPSKKLGRFLFPYHDIISIYCPALSAIISLATDPMDVTSAMVNQPITGHMPSVRQPRNRPWETVTVAVDPLLRMTAEMRCLCDNHQHHQHATHSLTLSLPPGD